MPNPFISAAGPAPAPGPEARWRQVALLATAAAVEDDPLAVTGLAATLHALDCPSAAARVAARAGHEPWARWWATVATGQEGDGRALPEAIARARREPAEGPDGREVERRLADLEAELAELGGGATNGARFALLGHRGRPDRRVLIGGRSSAAYLVDPRWDAVRLVRLAPSDGPAAGNRAHLTLPEVIAAVRRGEAGPGRPVPDDDPADLEPTALLEALREGPAMRDRRLLELADEVRRERSELMDERRALAEQRAALEAEAAVRRRTRPPRPPGAGRAAPVASVPLPRTRAEAAALLGIPHDARPAEVDRAYREQVTRCHPDRVAGLHPAIRERAEGLTVALNAARGLLAGTARLRAAQRARG